MVYILNSEPGNYCHQARKILKEIGRVDEKELSRQDLLSNVEKYDVLIVRLKHTIDREVIDCGKKLRFIVTPTTGLDHIDIEYASSKGIQVLSLKGQTEFLKSVRATAELTIGLAISLMRHIPNASQSVLQGDWNRDLFRGEELYGKTAGIVGLGRLGTIVAGYFKAFGMKVIGHDPYVVSNNVDESLADISELLSRSDLVSLHVSYDESTKLLIGHGELSRFKKGAYLINTSRGGIVDETALLTALQEGQIAGAALDVLSGEPHINSRHLLVDYAKKHSNVLIVPHIGGNTYESFIKTEIFMANLLQDKISQDSDTL